MARFRFATRTTARLAALSTLALCLAAPVAQAQDAATFAYLTPTRVIYPRETLRVDMVEARQAEALPGGVATSFDEAIGKAARATLLPGRAIPLAALGEPEAVKMGGSVTLAFRGGGMEVRAAGVALQAGAAGERIRARNASTGVVVTGLLRSDGLVMVEAGP